VVFLFEVQVLLAYPRVDEICRNEVKDDGEGVADCSFSRSYWANDGDEVVFYVSKG